MIRYSSTVISSQLIGTRQEELCSILNLFQIHEKAIEKLRTYLNSTLLTLR